MSRGLKGMIARRGKGLCLPLRDTWYRRFGVEAWIFQNWAVRGVGGLVTISSGYTPQTIHHVQRSGSERHERASRKSPLPASARYLRVLCFVLGVRAWDFHDQCPPGTDRGMAVPPCLSVCLHRVPAGDRHCLQRVCSTCPGPYTMFKSRGPRGTSARRGRAPCLPLRGTWCGGFAVEGSYLRLIDLCISEL